MCIYICIDFCPREKTTINSPGSIINAFQFKARALCIRTDVYIYILIPARIGVMHEINDVFKLTRRVRAHNAKVQK